tara:strand:+ start:2037 stop:2279 length:243 start_codon:yes stop_codon:yes gene_type:complete
MLFVASQRRRFRSGSTGLLWRAPLPLLCRSAAAITVDLLYIVVPLLMCIALYLGLQHERKHILQNKKKRRPFDAGRRNLS